MSREKRCSSCKAVKSSSEFHRNASSRDGLRSQCRQCYREYYKANRQRIAERQREAATNQPAGVYQIVHKPSGAVYIGSSDALDRRLGEHRSRLQRGIHGNPGLRALSQTSNIEDFEFKVICITPKGNHDLRLELEYQLILETGDNCLNKLNPLTGKEPFVGIMKTDNFIESTGLLLSKLMGLNGGF